MAHQRRYVRKDSVLLPMNRTVTPLGKNEVQGQSVEVKQAESGGCAMRATRRHGRLLNARAFPYSPLGRMELQR